MKQTTLLISLTLCVSLAVVVGLYVGTHKKMNLHYNSFDRAFVTRPFRGHDTLNIRYSHYYLAGATSSRIYLGNGMAPAHLLSVHTSLTDTTHIQIQVRDSLSYKSIRVAVDSPYFYLADGSIPFIYRGTLAGRQATRYIDDIFFITMLPISTRSFALVALNNMENTLEKKLAGSPQPEVFRDLLEEQGEGMFSTDGMLHYSRETARLVFVYFYRNQYLCMDTNFNLLQKGRTIDTVSRAKIKVGEISSSSEFTMAAPPLVVNSKSWVSGSNLYINSNLLAKNEDVETFERQSVVDVYGLEDNRYRFSFYIPAHNGGKITSFCVIDNKILVALYHHSLAAYTFSDSLFAEGRQAKGLRPVYPAGNAGPRTSRQRTD